MTHLVNSKPPARLGLSMPSKRKAPSTLIMNDCSLYLPGSNVRFSSTRTRIVKFILCPCFWHKIAKFIFLIYLAFIISRNGVCELLSHR